MTVRIIEFRDNEIDFKRASNMERLRCSNQQVQTPTFLIVLAEIPYCNVVPSDNIRGYAAKST